ncbi:MAG: hypothetical protein U1U88_001701 [Lawsonella clevelandensis]
MLQACSLSPRIPSLRSLGHVDATKTILTGHSAGGGSTESGSSWLLPQVEKKYPGLKVVAAVPLQPGPSVGFQPLLSKVPTFYLTGEKDTVCFDWSIRPRYKMNKNVPAWIAMVKGAPHGQEMDDWRNSAFAASVLAFADLYLNNTENARQIFLPELLPGQGCRLHEGGAQRQGCCTEVVRKSYNLSKESQLTGISRFQGYERAPSREGVLS